MNTSQNSITRGAGLIPAALLPAEPFPAGINGRFVRCPPRCDNDPDEKIFFILHDGKDCITRVPDLQPAHRASKKDERVMPVLIRHKDARDAIRTHEPLQERILSPSELAGLSYPRALNYYSSIAKKNPIIRPCTRGSGP